MKTLSVADFAVSPLQVEHATSTLISETISWKSQRLSRGLHRLVISGDIMLYNDADTKAWEAFYLSLKGEAEPFILDCNTDNDQWHNPFFTRVSGRHTTETKLGINQSKIGLIGNMSGIKPGCKFQIGSQTKVFTITSVSGNQIEFFPASRFDEPAGAIVTFNVKPKLYLSDSKSSVQYGERGTKVSFKCVEVM